MIRVENMYNKIVQISKRVKNEVNLIILGDFNATVGEGLDDEIVGPFILGTRNKMID